MKRKLFCVVMAVLLCLVAVFGVSAQSVPTQTIIQTRQTEAVREDFAFGQTLLISLAVGFAVALVVTLIFKGQLRSVRKQHAAQDYIKDGSLQLTLRQDLFLYRNVTRIRRAQNNRNGGR